jgi:hypothetical protein
MLRVIVAMCEVSSHLVSPAKWKKHFSLDADKEVQSIGDSHYAPAVSNWRVGIPLHRVPPGMGFRPDCADDVPRVADAADEAIASPPLSKTPPVFR